MSVYADTSFLVSLYVLDANSAQAAARMKTAKLPVLFAALGELELVNALYLRLFRREASVSTIKAAQEFFVKDLEAGILERRSISEAAHETAKRLAQKHTPRLGTRTLDLLHVASALVLQSDAFYTFDRNQAKLARAEGFSLA